MLVERLLMLTVLPKNIGIRTLGSKMFCVVGPASASSYRRDPSVFEHPRTALQGLFERCEVVVRH